MKTKLTVKHDSLRLSLDDGNHKVTLSIGRGGQRLSADPGLSKAVIQSLWAKFQKYVATGTYGERMTSLENAAKKVQTISALVLAL